MAATPFHFGDSERKLYGVYHAAEKRVARAPAALLFNPFGEEAIRAFRIFKLVAERLARNGISSLRFDPFGSGDSAGDDPDVTLSGMILDAEHAQEELAALSGARAFIWIGLGLGGAVAVRAANEFAPRLDRLVLWDPVTNGGAYLAELHGSYLDFLSYALDEPLEAVRKGASAAPDLLDEAIGFAVSQKLRDELLALDLVNEKLPQAEHITLINARSAPPDPQFLARLREGEASLDHFEDAAMSWNSNEALNAYYVPVPVIDHILDAARGAA